MKKILITGGTGFLGKHIAKKLKSNYKVIISGRNNSINKLAEDETGCEAISMNIDNIESVKDVFNHFKPKIIIHAAASKYVDSSEKYPLECIDTNIIGSQNIARVSIDKKIQTVIGISTDKTAPPVLNIYGLSKAIMERMFCNLSNVNDTKFACVRFGNIPWSTGSVFPIWKKMMEENNLIESTGPDMRRFFLSADNATNLVIRVLENISIFNGKTVSMKMKSSKISNILDIWCNNYNTSWKKIDKRIGDKYDEYLIGQGEIQYASKIIINNIIHYIIDFSKNDKIEIREPISTLNAEKFSKKEILKLIKFEK